MTLPRLIVCLALVAAVGPRVARADDAAPADAAGIEFFESSVRPVLVKHCYECHSVESGQAESGLRVDSRDALRAGGDRGPAVVPGDADASLLLTVVSHSDPDLKMPPKQERLPDQVIADLRKWVRMGAPDPREGTPAPARAGIDIEAGRQFWAFQKPLDHPLPPPSTRDGAWPQRDLDHFVLAKLEEHGLAPSPDAEPSTLLRRLHFDLVGLPPSPQDLSRFQERIADDGLDAALAAEVDTLLASPQFGERWGRHWLDVARFGESSGKEANITFPYAWRYRDYVIDCVNADMPYDRFLREQIAGDLLPCDSEAERARLLIATGFLAIGPKNLEESSAEQFLADIADEQIDTVTRAVMANSVACARCHDHKFDPFAMEDYYALAGIFKSTKTYFGTWVSPANRVGGDPLPLPRIEGLPIFHESIPAEQVEKLNAELAAMKKEQEDGMAAVMAALKAGKDTEGIFTLRDALRIFWRSGGIEGQLEKVDASGRALPLAMGVLDKDKARDAALLERGEIAKPRAPVPRGFPRVIALAECAPVPSDQSGRLELADWLTHPDHPLTARVMVNRIWRHLLGAGLVRTVDNFGTTGEAPSHPELLDHLALQFTRAAHGSRASERTARGSRATATEVADTHASRARHDEPGNWSLKHIVREIALSRTYRQASTFDERAFTQDPDNRLLWRAAKRRLDAEAIRDAMLAVSGEIDLARPSGSLVARVIGDRPVSLIGLDKRLPPDLDGAVHRSVYLPVLRDRLPDALDLFDFAEPSLVTGSRETTNVPVQALYLMNSPFVQARAEALAARLARETDDDADCVRQAFLLCYSREPDADEARTATAFLTRAEQTGQDDENPRQEVLVNFCHALLSTAEFRNVD